MVAAVATLALAACGPVTGAPATGTAPGTATAGTATAGTATTGTATAGTAARGAVTAGGGGVRMVVFGDSVPYGFGLADPGRTRQGGLPPGQGPSARAWPSLVRAGLTGFAPLRLRPTACTLASTGARPFDTLAVSGAAAVRNRFSGADDNCTDAAGKALPEPVVDPDQLAAARLQADPPALVALQVGANDVDFVGCLSALLGLSAADGAVPCVTRTAAGLRSTPRTRIELAGLARGLTAIIRTVHRAAPHARIVVVDYYQVAPAASAPVAGSTPLCTDIALRSAIPGWRAAFRARAAFALGRLDATIAGVVHRFPDVSLVSLTSAFAGHELCTAQPWIFSNTWDAAHPTAVGQRHIAAAVLADCARLPKKCRGR